MFSVHGILAANLLLTTDILGRLLRALLLLDGPSMLVLALLDSSFFPIPEGNDLLIVGLSIGKAWSRITYYIAMSAVGSICGCILLYTLGRRGGSLLLQKHLPLEKREWMESLFRRYGLFALIVPSLLPPPCPFKVFVLSAGVFGVRLRDFLTAVTVGRLARYSIWGVLAFQYGDRLKRFMEVQLWVPGFGLAGLFLIAAAILVYRHLRRTRSHVGS